jgi:hypothetical protein
VSFGLQPLASLMAGFSAERLGTPAAIAINGLLLVLIAGLILLLRPELRAWTINSIVGAKPEMIETAA